MSIDITIQEFLDKLSVEHDSYLAWLGINVWLWEHFCFDDKGAHYINTGERPYQPVSGGMQ